MQEIKWGSIGCGDVMEVKSGPALQSAHHSSLVAVMRRDALLSEDFARRHNIPKWYDKAESLVSDPDVNAIYVSTPPDTHLKYTRMAALAGKPVYVEKPMANSYAECLEMVRICKAQQVPLFVAYYRRALPRFLKVKALIDSGALGDIQSVDIQLLQKPNPGDIEGKQNWRVQPEIAGCGYFCDLGSHMFDLQQYLLGDISSASGRSGNTGGFYEAEDFVEAEFTFSSAVNGTGMWNFNADKNLDQTTIIGTDGDLSFSHFSEADVKFTSHGKLQIFELPNPVHIQQPLIQLMVDELLGSGKCPSTGVSAAETNRIMDLVLGRMPQAD